MGDNEKPADKPSVVNPEVEAETAACGRPDDRSQEVRVLLTKSILRRGV
jgi:hypothetical protein